MSNRLARNMNGDLLAISLAFTSLLVVQQRAQAIVTSDFVGSHIAENAFGVNLDGVALLGGIGPTGLIGGTCSGALISDRHVLTAAHCLDAEADLEIDDFYFLFASSVVFVVDDTAMEISFDLNNVQWPNTWGEFRSDIAVLTLEEDAPEMLPRYQLYSGLNEVGQRFVLAGFGNAGYGSSGEDVGFDSEPTKRAGLNRYEAIFPADEENEFLAYDFDSGDERHNSLLIAGGDSDLGFGPDEVMSAGRDSGGPGFLNGAIASIVAFGDRIPSADVNDVLDSSWGESGFDLRISGYRDFISSATNGQAVFVPEPQSSFMWAVVLVIPILQLRRPR